MQLVACLLWEQEVVGSSPAIPTKFRDLEKTIRSKIKEFKFKLANKAHQIEHAAIIEAKETHEAALILWKMAKGKKVSDKEIKFLKAQSVDVGKALAIIGLQAVPFSSAAIIAIEVVAKKYGFSIFPTSQKKTNMNSIKTIYSSL